MNHSSRRPNTSTSTSSRISSAFTPNRVWLVVFGLWGVFLTGVVANPGFIQAARLRNLLNAKQQQIRQYEETLERLAMEASLLEKNQVVQHREIRKVLGYAASNEIIFDFSKSGESDL